MQPGNQSLLKVEVSTYFSNRRSRLVGAPGFAIRSSAPSCLHDSYKA
jgi:hypothetical protein